MEIGEAFVGEGADAAHINTVLGGAEGPVGSAFVTALATPRAGHAGFLVIAKPGVAVVPPTLFVNKATIAGDTHAALTWGAAQAGVARGVALALEGGVVARDEAGGLVLIVAAWVNPAAADGDAVARNNAAATCQALAAGRAGEGGLEAFLEAARSPYNAYFPAHQWEM